MATSSEIVLSGYSTKQIERLLETSRDNLERRKRQSTIAFELYCAEENKEKKFDLYDLFSLVSREIMALEDNVEMFQKVLTKRTSK